MRKALLAVVLTTVVLALHPVGARATLGDFVKPPTVTTAVSPGESVKVVVEETPGSDRVIAIVVSVP